MFNYFEVLFIYLKIPKIQTNINRNQPKKSCELVLAASVEKKDETLLKPFEQQKTDQQHSESKKGWSNKRKIEDLNQFKCFKITLFFNKSNF